METKREQELREQKARYEKRMEQIAHEIEGIEKRRQKARDKERDSRLFNKAANEEALFAFEQMDMMTHLEFIRELTKIDAAADLIYRYHIKTGGTQYVSVDDFRSYVSVKYPECLATTRNVVARANKRKAAKEGESQVTTTLPNT